MTHSTPASIRNKWFSIRELDLDVVFGEKFFYNFSSFLIEDLAVFENSVRLLKENSNQKDGDLSGETFFLIECAIESMHEFIEDLDFLGKPFDRDGSKQLSKLSLNKVLQKSISDIENKNLEISRIEIKISGLDEIICNEFLLNSVIVHLVSNSLKFSKDKVCLIIDSFANELIITVKDSGIGIPENEIKNVFVPFYKGSNAKRISGKGLGLTIVRKALGYFNGQVLIKSEVLIGTEVKVSIPLKVTLLDNISFDTNILL